MRGQMSLSFQVELGQEPSYLNQVDHQPNHQPPPPKNHRNVLIHGSQKNAKIRKRNATKLELQENAKRLVVNVDVLIFGARKNVTRKRRNVGKNLLLIYARKLVGFAELVILK